MATLTIWRHPKPRGAAGRCIGSRTDLPVDPRKAKRLAHRIRAHARRQGLPREVVTSPLRRAADVGRWLKRWGFRWRVDPDLAEIDFGKWDGQPWSAISAEEFQRWMQDFAGFDFDGGEALVALLSRVASWRAPGACSLAVGHGGWISARRWHEARSTFAPQPGNWPPSITYAKAANFAASTRA